MKLSYQNELKAEEYGIAKSTKIKVKRGTKGQKLLNEVVIC